MQDTARGDFPAYLRDAMRAIGLPDERRGSRATLARLSGVPSSAISRWLGGDQQPDIENLRKVAPVLRVRMLDLLVVAGHISPAEAGDVARSPEESIREDTRLSPRDKRVILAMLTEMRERTGTEPDERAHAHPNKMLSVSRDEHTA